MSVQIHSVAGWVKIIFCVLIIWAPLRLTFLMLTLKPALVLSNESITIAESGYTIKWTDIGDVYLSSSGGDSLIPLKSYYIIVKVREAERKGYMMQLRNPFTRWYRWATRNWRTSLFEVNLSLIRGDNDELFHTVLKYYQNNRGGSKTPHAPLAQKHAPARDPHCMQDAK